MASLGADIDMEADSDWLGYSVDIGSDGKRMAIGAPLNNNDQAFARCTYIFQELDKVWVQMGADIDRTKGDFSRCAVVLSRYGVCMTIRAFTNDDI